MVTTKAVAMALEMVVVELGVPRSIPEAHRGNSKSIGCVVLAALPLGVRRTNVVNAA